MSQTGPSPRWLAHSRTHSIFMKPGTDHLFGLTKKPWSVPGFSCDAERAAGAIEQARGDERGSDALDLGLRNLDEGRTHRRARKLAHHHQRFLHSVVHVDPRLGVERFGRRPDALVDLPRGREIVRAHRPEKLGL